MPTKKIVFGNLEEASKDPLRRDKGEWFNTQEGIKFIFNDEPQYITVFSDFEKSAGGVSVGTVTISLNNNNSNIPSILSEIMGKVYEDFVTSLEADITFEEAININLDIPSDSMGADFIYNYYDFEYEQLLQTVQNHNLIPNMYILLEQAHSNNNQGRNILGESLANILQSNIDSPPATRVDDQARPLPPGFSDLPPSVTTQISNFSHLTNQMVVPENNQYIRENENNKFLFPIYSQINIPVREEEGTEISKAIEESELSAILMRAIFEPLNNQESISFEDLNYSYNYYTAGATLASIDNFRATTKRIDLDTWIDRDLPTWYSGKELLDNWSFIGIEERSENISVDPDGANFPYHLNLLKDKLNEIYREQSRNLLEIYLGKKAYSETIMYRVTKYLGQGIETPIQNFYFYNTDEVTDFLNTEKKITFIDTQVKYNQTYTYSVLAYRAVIGTKYEYVDPSVEDGLLRMRVIASPSTKIVETPLFQTVGKILSDPPLPPEVHIFPIKGRTNLFKVFLASATNAPEDLIPVPLNEQEILDYIQVGLNQKRTDGLITFTTDDNNSSYNIYRLMNPPKSYTDFNESLLTSVSTTTDNLEASSATININQTTNRKYYYIFRSVDRHGLLSNPSPVYEIELYDDGGAGYPVIKIYEFPPIKQKISTKSARKLIQIIPRITQGYFNESKTGVLNEDGSLTVGNKPMVLGVEDESLFATTAGYGVKTGKRFKIRLISKSTGKKVDLNVDFNTNRVRSEIE